jgi:hypothetical protein
VLCIVGSLNRDPSKWVANAHGILSHRCGVCCMMRLVTVDSWIIVVGGT